MDNKQRKKLARAQTRKIIFGILKALPKNVWNFVKDHKKETFGALIGLGGAITFAGCVPKNNPPAIIQPSGDIESGDINSGDINSGEEKPDIPSGDIGSGDIGSGEEKPEPPSGETPDSGEENPGEEIKYPSTIAEMTDEQKQTLVNFLDEKYKHDIALSSGVIDASAENTKTIGYTLEENHAEALFATTNDAGTYIYKIETGAEIDISKFFEALDKNEDPSEFAKFTFAGYKKSSLFLIAPENEYSANAETAYIQSNKLLQEPTELTEDMDVYALGLSDVPVTEFGGMGRRIKLTRFSIDEKTGEIVLHSFTIVVKNPQEYQNIGKTDVIILFNGEENYLEFGNKTTIYATNAPAAIKE